ncbi:MAG TPA: hypothetical protein VJX23_14010 [Candidatus Binataceae bacterium]|nr:hypothetical protein [Candidatus Binataceae bacterium]
METATEQPAPRVEIEQLTKVHYFLELTHGIGLTLGMLILWSLEVVRNGYFHLLDRMNLKPRRNMRASAFPPGRPKKRKQLRA